MTKSQKIFANLFLLIIVVSISLLLSEIIIRKFIPFSFNKDERNLSYDHDPELGWFPEKDFSKEFFGSKLIKVTQNKEGFRDIDHSQDNNLPNIAFLGDSFTWGYDVENNEIFTELLRAKFAKKYNIYNLGISGYSTDQEFLLLQRFYDKIKPEIVFVIFCINDNDGNARNVIYQGYYKPYYTYQDGKLTLNGVPVPISGNYKMLEFVEKNPIISKSDIIKWSVKLFHRAKHNIAKQRHLQDPTLHIIAEMNKFITSKGSKLVVGMIDDVAEVNNFLDKENITRISLKNDFRYTEKGQHWTPEGHKFASDKIADFLQKNK